MDVYIPISYLNDYIFCPRSIYFHNLYQPFSTSVYHQSYQTKGQLAHASIDSKAYSTSSHILQSLEVYCEKYNLGGKIDVFDVSTGKLTERKRSVKVLYDGYIFQLYAHYFALTELGYEIKTMVIYDMIHNKSYPIALPQDDLEMFIKFESLVGKLNSFDLESTPFIAEQAKCDKCIYNALCDKSLAKGS